MYMEYFLISNISQLLTLTTRRRHLQFLSTQVTTSRFLLDLKVLYLKFFIIAYALSLPCKTSLEENCYLSINPSLSSPTSFDPKLLTLRNKSFVHIELLLASKLSLDK